LDAKHDAEVIHKAIAGLGTDEKALINVIGRRPNWHMQKVREEYEKLYQKDLMREVESDVSFNFKKLLIGLIKSRSEYRAEEIYKAMKGLGTDEWTLIDFIIATDDHSVEEFKQFFRQKYDTSLVDFVKGDTSGNFEKVLVSACEAKRATTVDEGSIDSDVEKLYKAGEGKWGTDEKTFIEILTHRSFEHLIKVAQRYKEKHKHTLEHAITSETSGWFKSALLTCIDLPAVHWAKRMNQAIKGLGTNDFLIVHCFSQCSKPFIQEIAKEYVKLYKVTLEEDIKGDTSGDYRELLLTLLDFPESERKNY